MIDLFGDKQSDNFESWWKIYPRKVAKQAARKAWQKLNLDPHAPKLITKLREQVEQCANFDKDKQFIPHAATYLNGYRWQDEIEPKERPGLPHDDAQLATYAAEHGLPAARPGESSREYRARLMTV